MTSIRDSLTGFNQYVGQRRQCLAPLVTRRIEQQLETDVTAWLHRRSYQRRTQVAARHTRAVCCRCGSGQVRDFSRNGHRQRQVVTTYGVVTFWLPRVVCRCGGSVSIPFSILQPYQRLWDDVVEQIARWADLGLSLRQMQGEIGQQAHTQVGLRKLNAVVQAVDQPADIPLTSVPPIIMLDAIWVTVLRPTQQTRRDRLGCQRITKAADQVPVLIALGLYPQSHRWGILDWQLAKAEDQTAWECLLLRLEERGVYGERGVELFLHDGGQGLIAALNLIHPHIAHQRCVFHKLRNLWQAIQVPDHLSPGEARLFKHHLIGSLAAIYQAPTQADAGRLGDRFCQRWQSSQPQLVATLLRDWPDTVAFYRVMLRFLAWQPTALRTTSLLQRVNRMIRRLFRAAGAYHSISGLLATLARLLTPLRFI